LIDFIDYCIHLVRVITSDLDDGTDVLNTRYNFIQQTNNMLLFW